MKLLFSFVLLSIGIFPAPAQTKKDTGKHKIKSPVQIAVDRIDAILKKTMADTAIQIATIEYAPNQKDKLPGHDKYVINGTYKNGELLMLQKSTGHNLFFNGSSKTIYFDKGQAVLYVEQYSNRSRMGSCGEISVSFYHYLKDSIAFAGLGKSVTSFYYCYQYKLLKPDTKKLFDEIDNIKALLNNKKAVQLPVKQPGRYFFHPHLLNASDTIQESYGF